MSLVERMPHGFRLQDRYGETRRPPMRSHSRLRLAAIILVMFYSIQDGGADTASTGERIADAFLTSLEARGGDRASHLNIDAETIRREIIRFESIQVPIEEVEAAVQKEMAQDQAGGHRRQPDWIDLRNRARHYETMIRARKYQALEGSVPAILELQFGYLLWRLGSKDFSDIAGPLPTISAELKDDGTPAAPSSCVSIELRTPGPTVVNRCKYPIRFIWCYVSNITGCSPNRYISWDEIVQPGVARRLSYHVIYYSSFDSSCPPPYIHWYACSAPSRPVWKGDSVVCVERGAMRSPSEPAPQRQSGRAPDRGGAPRTLAEFNDSAKWEYTGGEVAGRVTLLANGDARLQIEAISYSGAFKFFAEPHAVLVVTDAQGVVIAETSVNGLFMRMGTRGVADKRDRNGRLVEASAFRSAEYAFFLFKYCGWQQAMDRNIVAHNGCAKADLRQEYDALVRESPKALGAVDGSGPFSIAGWKGVRLSR